MTQGSDFDHDPDLSELIAVSALIGFTSFGGPAGQIALMHSELVEKRRWIGEEEFLHALNFCHLLPGPEAQQLATYIGWRLHGWKGGLVSGVLFILPGALVMLALSILYGAAAGMAWFTALFAGIKAAVLAIIAQALVRLSGRALSTGFRKGLAFAAFLAIALFAVPFPLVVLGAGMLGMVVAALRPAWLGAAPVRAAGAAPVRAAGAGPANAPPLLRSASWALAGGAVWGVPMLAVLLALGPGHVLWKLGLFFSQLAVVTFGGAYAVLAYMAQEAVATFGWLTPGEMADGLGLAETTPGPLILVTQFVGYLAAFRDPAPFSPLAAGVLGAALTTWVTFVPCFTWIFVFGPWIDRLRSAERLKGGLAAITAAVVGVIASLALWFAAHVLFARTVPIELAGRVLILPDWRGFDPVTAGIATLSAILLFRCRLAPWQVLAAAAAMGLVLAG